MVLALACLWHKTPPFACQVTEHGVCILRRRWRRLVPWLSAMLPWYCCYPLHMAKMTPISWFLHLRHSSLSYFLSWKFQVFLIGLYSLDDSDCPWDRGPVGEVYKLQSRAISEGHKTLKVSVVDFVYRPSLNTGSSSRQQSAGRAVKPRRTSSLKLQASSRPCWATQNRVVQKRGGKATDLSSFSYISFTLKVPWYAQHVLWQHALCSLD